MSRDGLARDASILVLLVHGPGHQRINRQTARIESNHIRSWSGIVAPLPPATSSIITETKRELNRLN